MGSATLSVTSLAAAGRLPLAPGEPQVRRVPLGLVGPGEPQVRRVPLGLVAPGEPQVRRVPLGLVGPR